MFVFLCRGPLLAFSPARATARERAASPRSPEVPGAASHLAAFYRYSLAELNFANHTRALPERGTKGGTASLAAPTPLASPEPDAAENSSHSCTRCMKREQRSRSVWERAQMQHVYALYCARSRRRLPCGAADVDARLGARGDLLN
ncbi:hypothetical protein HPB50_004428 [Hyalomma asiaticum]|uniref:Uncharacterized protein n=1 Tax=Hyalomma asiaticum TaxID=266040 RepID=A0ACB7TEH8_HYAAI|nr:hypothetical protein HPB50_004428 [Hyalomma asiaticum]